MNKIWLQSAGVVVSLGACFTYSQELSTFNEQLLKSRQRMVAAIDSAVEKGRWTRRSADVSEIQNVLSTDVSTFYLSLIKSTQQNQLRLIEKNGLLI